MNDIFILMGRSRCNTQSFPNLHHYKYNLFNTIIDLQVQDINSLFTDANTKLFLCVACLNLNDFFVAFNEEKLLHFVKFYILIISHHTIL